MALIVSSMVRMKLARSLRVFSCSTFIFAFSSTARVFASASAALSMTFAIASEASEKLVSSSSYLWRYPSTKPFIVPTILSYPGALAESRAPCMYTAPAESSPKTQTATKIFIETAMELQPAPERAQVFPVE
eukprot:CAMPEP_0169110264 /NCGR_PEP_ID=MMETSP1015-20121227/26418_1 /TAXON_ID=342587 /ORGANISM="Karlodinium micrum, Strain CCMP2283" /LENGTH=131 /DNA_ID=CAMNT_0009172041 /DNA_START=209 /DNA_END=604 /DNA_ORIENTATION=+